MPNAAFATSSLVPEKACFSKETLSMESSNLFSAFAASCKLEKLFKADTISPLFFIDFVNSPIFFNCVIG